MQSHTVVEQLKDEVTLVLTPAHPEVEVDLNDLSTAVGYALQRARDEAARKGERIPFMSDPIVRDGKLYIETEGTDEEFARLYNYDVEAWDPILAAVNISFSRKGEPVQLITNEVTN